tara:strand:+ start:891 stop:1529 length:639 start_codon:yes stop_codon:yes gene_type:complete
MLPARSEGLFVTLEGGEGAGKSTQLKALANRARVLGIETVTSREPGGTPLGESLRNILLNANDSEVDHRAELLVFAASRAQHLAELVRPALERGALVICDRFSDSTIAYQQYGRGLDPDIVATSIELATDGLKPDLTILLDVESHVSRERTTLSDDYLERAGIEFHERVHAGFVSLAASDPDRWIVIDGAIAPDEITELAWNQISKYLDQAT